MKKIIIIILIFLVIGVCTLLYLKMKSNESGNLNEVDNQLNNKNDKVGGESVNEFVNKINININGVTYTATLEDNDTAKELVSRMPFTIEMNELNSNEKYYYFDKSFPTNSSRINRINNGDIMLYGSDCLVLFYESFNTSYSYTRIGKIDNPNNLKNVVGNGNITITFTK